MSDRADSNPQNSFWTIEQAVEQAYLDLQAEFSPAGSSASQAQDSPSTASSTPPLISSPRQGSDEFYDLPRDLTSDFESPTNHPTVTMTNPTSQLPSYDSDPVAKANSSYFRLTTGRSAAEIERNQVVVKKEKRGEEGSKQFTSNYTAATEALKPGFGAAKHFVQRSKDGEEADAGNTNYTYIQEFFCSNLTKVDSLEHRVIAYDFKDILMLRELRDFNQVDP